MDDYEAVRALYEEPGTLTYMPSFFPAEEPEAYFESYVKFMYRFYDFGMYVLEDARYGKIIGHAGLGVEDGEDSSKVGRNGGEVVVAGGMPVKEQADARITLGYVISAPYRHKGLATLACRKILLYARDSLYLDHVWIRVAQRNGGSLAVAHHLQQLFGDFVIVDVT